MSTEDKSRQVMQVSSIQDVTHVPCSSTPLPPQVGQSRNSKRSATDTPLRAPPKVGRFVSNEATEKSFASSSSRTAEDNKLCVLLRMGTERGDVEVSKDNALVSSLEVGAIEKKLSQKQCLRVLNTRLANNIERIGPLVAENHQLTQMNELLRNQLQQEKEERKRQLELIRKRLDKAVQEKAQTEIEVRVNEENVARLKDEVLAGRRLFAEFRKKEAVLKSELSSLCSASALKDTQLGELKKVLSGEQMLRMAAEETLKTSTKNIKVAENRLKETLEELAMEQRRAQDLQMRNESLQQEKVALVARFNTNSEQNQHLSLELSRLREEYDILMSTHNANLKKSFEQELDNYVPKMEHEKVTQLIRTQHNEIERLRSALELAEARHKEWEKQHSKLIRDWHEDKMLLYDCRKEIRTFKLLIDQMDLATPKEILASKVLTHPEEAIEGEGQQTSESIGGTLNRTKSANCIFM